MSQPLFDHNTNPQLPHEAMLEWAEKKPNSIFLRQIKERHFVLLVLDLANKVVVVYDGLRKPVNLWTEYVKTTDHAEYMLLPRLTALSEVLWSTPEQRNWSDFQERLQYLQSRFEVLHWNYRSEKK